jgi:uncharacterized protein DUF2442
MNISAAKKDTRAVSVVFSDDSMKVRLTDGREISVPLEWFPVFKTASLEQKNNWRLIGDGIGIHWEDLDEDISVEGLLY